LADTIFGKIFTREIPAEIVYEDDDVLAFRDVAAQAPTHILIVPKKPLASLLDAAESDAPLMGKLLLASVHVARTLGIAEDGFRVVINVGKDGGQTVNHLHLHLLGGRHLTWPPG